VAFDATYGAVTLYACPDMMVCLMLCLKVFHKCCDVCDVIRAF